MQITLGQIMSYGSFFGAAIAVLSFLWVMANSIINRIEKKNERSMDREYGQKTKLQQEKADLIRANEDIKQRYIRTMMDEVKAEVRAVDKRVQTVVVNYARVDEKMKANVQAAKDVIAKVQCFVDSTDKRFQTVEKQLGDYRTELIPIRENLALLRSIAERLKKPKS